MRQKSSTQPVVEVNYELYKRNFGPNIGLEKWITRRGLDTKEEPDMILHKCQACDHGWHSSRYENRCPACFLEEKPGGGIMISRLRVNAREYLKTVKITDKRTGKVREKRVPFLRALAHVGGKS